MATTNQPAAEKKEEPKKEEPKSTPTRTFKLIGGPHVDKDGVHEAGTPTELVTSTEDLVAKHGVEKFVEVK